MTVYLTSAYVDSEPLETMIGNSRIDRAKIHQLVNNPAEADMIVFVENSRYHHDSFFKILKSNELVKTYPDKVFIYNPHDHPWYVLRGLYPSMPKKRFDENCMAAVPYISVINNKITYVPEKIPKFLYSFLGSPNSPVRRAIITLSHPKGYIKASENFYAQNDTEVQKLDFADVLTNSKYVLCPKGAGTSSFRIYEAMQAGRVPVIISDEWVPPKGPKWEEFAIFIPEKEVQSIQKIIEADQDNWEEKAARSRKAWEEFFSPDVIFNYFINCIINFKDNAPRLRKSLYLTHRTSYIKFFLRKFFIEKVKSVLNYK